MNYASGGMWAIFFVLITFLLAFDLGVLNKKDHEIPIKESLQLSAFYIVIAVLFGLWIGYMQNSQAMMEYYTAYFVEKSLSLDNLFVISLIFSYFAIPRQSQHRVLFWGILGVIILRGLMIGLGVMLVKQVSWILYVFGAFLIVVGIRLLLVKNEKKSLEQNRILQFVKKHFRLSPLLMALIVIELTDLVFAIDSIPAVFAITTNTYVVYTSNIFAILGLRALYFALAALLHRFHYLAYAIALVLIFIGSKVFLPVLLGIPKFPPLISLLVTMGLLAGGVVFSWIRTLKQTRTSS